MNKAKEAVQQLREKLLEDHEFEIVNGAGDLARGDERVTTRYCGGEFFVTTWIRTPGTLNRDSTNRRTVRVTDRLLAQFSGYMGELLQLIARGQAHTYNGPGANVLDRPKTAVIP